MGRVAQQLELPRWLSTARLPVAAFFLIFVAWPVGLVAVAAWDGPGSGPRVDLLGSVTLISAGQATLSAVLTVVCGLPLTLLVSRRDFPAKRLLSALVLLPFLLPTVVTGLALRQSVGEWLPDGLLLVVLAHAFVNLAVVVRLVGPVAAVVDERFSQVAESLGARKRELVATVWWPALRAPILAASAVVWVYCFSSLGLMLLLGGGLQTLDTLLLRQVGLLLDFKAAAATALLQFIAVSAVLLCSTRMARGPSRYRGAARPRTLAARWRWLPFALAALFAMPLISLVMSSFSGVESWTAQWWSDLLRSSSPVVPAGLSAPLLRSVVTAMAAGAIAASLALMIALSVIAGRRGVARLSVLPMGISSVTLGLGLLLAASRLPLNALPRSLLLPLAHVVFALPLVSALVLPVLRSADPRLLLLARSLGAESSRALLTAYGPVLRRIGATAFTLAAAVSLGEYGAASFLTSADGPTLPVEVMRLLSRPGAANLGTAAALSLVLGVTAAALFAAADRSERRSL